MTKGCDGWGAVRVQFTFVHVGKSSDGSDSKLRSQSMPAERLHNGRKETEQKYACDLLSRASTLLSPKSQMIPAVAQLFAASQSQLHLPQQGFSNTSHESEYRSDASTEAPTSVTPSSRFVNQRSRQRGVGLEQKYHSFSPVQAAMQGECATAVPGSWTDMYPSEGWADMHSWACSAVDPSQNNEKSQIEPCEAAATAVADEPITTMMLCDMPCRILRRDVALALDAEGFAGLYDHVHVPTTAKVSSSLGYAFINFLDPASASRFAETFNGYRFLGTQSKKVCNVRKARMQGANAIPVRKERHCAERTR